MNVTIKMAGDRVAESEPPKFVCNYCGKTAVNRIVKCRNCVNTWHRSCCERNNLEVAVNNTTNCCMKITTPHKDSENAVDEGRKATEDGDAPEGEREGRDDVRLLLLEITYLKELLIEKQRTIDDKCTIIVDKDCIIKLLNEQLCGGGAVNGGRLHKCPTCDRNRGRDGDGGLRGVVHSDGDDPVSRRDREKTEVDRLDGTSGGVTGDKSLSSASNRSTRPEGGSNKRVNKNTNSAEAKADEHVNKNAKSTDGTEDWQVVKRKGRQGENGRRFSTEIIRGDNEKVESLCAAPKMAYLHIARLHPTTTADDVTRYLSQLCKGVIVERLESRQPEIYSSFKLTAAFDSLEILKNPNTWPKGATIKRFFHRRNHGAPRG